MRAVTAAAWFGGRSADRWGLRGAEFLPARFSVSAGQLDDPAWVTQTYTAAERKKMCTLLKHR